jgi:hypothetical protein
LEFNGIQFDKGATGMEEVITIDDEEHLNCGLGIAEFGIGFKSEIRIPCLPQAVESKICF